MKVQPGVQDGKPSVLPDAILQEELLKQNSLLNLLPIAVYVCDDTGIIRQYNDHAVQLWGRKPALNHIDERFCGPCKLYQMNGHELPHALNPVAGCLADGKPRKNMDVVIERADHSHIIVRMNVAPITSQQGKTVGALTSFYDITAEKQSEKESESYYQQVLHGFPAAIYTTDTNGFVTQYNEAAVALWGRTPEIGKDLWCGSWKIYNTDGTERPLESGPMATALKYKKPIYGEEIVIERPDGSRRLVAPHPRPIFDSNGQLTGAVNMLVDITEIKSSELALRDSERNLRMMTEMLEKKVTERTMDLLEKNEELQKSEERYYRMIDEIEDYAIFMINRDGYIQNWNRGAEKIKGYKEDEIIGKHFSIFYTSEDKEKGIHQKLLQEAEKNGKALSEGWRVRKNGSRIWASILITALHDKYGNVIGFSKVTRDITERKITEDKIKQNNADLEFQNQELEQFAYAAAHDLKEPLRKIQFYSNYIAETIGNELPDKQKDYMNRAINAASRMQGLIDDLLTYSKTTSYSQQFEEVNLNAVLDEVLALHHTTIEKTNTQVKRTPMPIIMGIPFQCTQLLDNLIGNSLKYRHPHRVPQIIISAEKVSGASIRENLIHKQKDYYKISITDNGIGFEPGHADTIFNLFQRLHGGGSYSGTGIGLAICKRIVQNHKGFINAMGTPGQGAQFNIYLPC
jgi:PAS domain S-box